MKYPHLNCRRNADEPMTLKCRCHADAVFIGWQEFPGGAFALFNIVQEYHPRFGSTVSGQTLQKEGLKIPDFPSFDEWVSRKLLP